MTLSAPDRIEIHELMAQYANAVDVDGREEDLFEIFTPDALLDSPMSGKFAGTGGLREFAKVVAGLRQGRIGRHLITNVRIRGEGDRAEIKAYFLHIATPGAANAPAGKSRTEITNSGCYDCVARKIAGRWWLQRRTVLVDDR